MLQVRMHRPPRRFPIDTLRFLATSTRHHTFFPFFLFLFLFFSFAFSFSFPFSQWNQTCRLLFEEIHNLYLFAISIWHRLHTFFRLVSPFSYVLSMKEIFEETRNLHLFGISIRVSSWFIYSFIFVETSRNSKNKSFTRPLYFSIGFFLFEQINCNFLSIFE